MSDITLHPDSSTGEPLTGAYRSVRRVAPPESPFPGILTRTIADEPVVLVRARDLQDWPGWRATSPHVLGPIDVALTDTGAAAVLPWCVERIDRLIARRIQSGMPLADGESVTLTVSLLRGLAAVSFDARSAPVDPLGSWWLTDDGRPVFVYDAAAPSTVSERGTDAVAAAGAIISAVRDDCSPPVARALREAADAVVDLQGIPHEAERLEGLLFAQADPSPIETVVLAPARARHVTARSNGSLTRSSAVPDDDARQRGALLAPLLDGGMVELASGTLHAVARWLRGRRRLAMLAIALAVGGSVLAFGLLWPEPGTSAVITADPAAADPAMTDPPTPTPPAASSQPTPAADAPSEPPDSSGDLAVVGANLLTERTACARDADCLAAAVEDPTRALAAGVIDSPAAGRRVTLLDEFGGVAVLRVDAADGASAPQLVVIVRGDAGWLIRDVHDVANQPG